MSGPPSPHATLDKFTDTLRQKITIPHAPTNKNVPFARPPPNRAHPQVTVSYTRAVTNTLGVHHNNATTPHRTKKARNNEGASVTSEHSTETIQTQTTVSTITNMKQELLTTLRQEFTQLVKADLTPIMTKLQEIKQTITSNAEAQQCQHSSLQAITRSNHDQFQAQLTDLNQQFHHQLKAQQAQMNAFFTQFAQYTKQYQPPSAMDEGGME